jgi:hypothetical protein
MINIGISEFIMNFFYYEVTWRLESLLWIYCCKLNFKFSMHFLKYSKALLVPVVYLRKQWEIISCILIKHIVFNNDHL